MGGVGSGVKVGGVGVGEDKVRSWSGGVGVGVGRVWSRGVRVKGVRVGGIRVKKVRVGGVGVREGLGSRFGEGELGSGGCMKSRGWGQGGLGSGYGVGGL